MKKLKEELKYGKKGITLISLVVTIIVLLILAGVTIATLTGENGILTRATEAKDKTEEAQEKEGLELAVTSSQMEDVNTLEITEEKLSDAIKQQFGNDKDFSITDNRDGSFLVSMNDTKRMYYVDETGEIIDKILKISTAGELKLFRDDVNSGNTYEDWYIYLANDITLNINEEWEPIGKYSDDNTKPNMQFKGIFDGKDYEILGLYINRENDRYQGMFGYNMGTVKNLTISADSYVKGKGNTGAIAGYNGSKVLKCTNQAMVQSNYNNTGGIVGKNEGYINNCKNEGVVKNTSQATGGVVGWNCTGGIVENCYNNANITTEYQMTGGVVGSNDGIVRKCFNSSEILTSSFTIGGIVGQNNGQIEECFNERKCYI